ncbi:hypothetical protein [Marinicrinis lubricantis]|uniref:Beta-barrel assembly machine subunit BamE n=1 Tax=Marinicrinis lubricantis TaxID=2086470 RepID=A0ABW1IPH4_9BACL
MKKLIFISMVLLLTIALSGCSFQYARSDLPIEMVAFNSLTDAEKDQIPVSPKDSVVGRVTVNDDIAALIGNDYNGKAVFVVMFNHTDTNSSGNLTVYVDLDKRTVIGKGFSDKSELKNN